MAKNIWMREIPLLSAECKVILTASRGGAHGRVMTEVFPFPHSGTAPGILLRYSQHWKEALKTAMALKELGTHIRNGIDVVPGTQYAPVKLSLGQGGEYDGTMRLVLTADDCETWMHFYVDGAEFASQEPGIIVGAMSR